MTSSTNIDVSIVMPCLNEEQTLPQCIQEGLELAESLKQQHGLHTEIVIADNGSEDNSVQLAQSLGARVAHVPQKGYGNALRYGIEASQGRYIVMADSDASYDLREAISMVERLQEGYDVCMGSRFKGEIMPGAMPWKHRYIGNPVLTGILNVLFRSGLSDAHSGMRAFTRNAFDRMKLSSTGMEFASEMVIKATLLDLKRTETPITLRPDGRNRAPHLRSFRDGWRHLRYLIMLSPSWLYFLPSIVLGAAGFLILAILLSAPGETVVRIGPIWFGDHWIMIASGLLIVAHQAIMFGMATILHGTLDGYRRPKRWLLKLYRVVDLEIMIIMGLIAALLGIIIFGLIFTEWTTQGFSSLDRLREMGVAVTLGVIGIQNIFSGFLLAIISGNRTDVHHLVSSTVANAQAEQVEPVQIAEDIPSGASA